MIILSLLFVWYVSLCIVFAFAPYQIELAPLGAPWPACSFQKEHPQYVSCSQILQSSFPDSRLLVELQLWPKRESHLWPAGEGTSGQLDLQFVRSC